MKPIICLLMALSLITPVFADCNPGFLGYFDGNDDVASVNAALGINASQLGKVDSPPGYAGNFVINVSDWDGSDPLAGTWSWSGITPLNLLTLKAGDGWAAYCILSSCGETEFSKRSFLSSSFSQSRAWDTFDLGEKGLSHASAWSVQCVDVPEPSTLMIVLILLISLTTIAFIVERVL